ncbi:MAG TPA: hypothetical protein VJG85_02115 [Patescibacteria group bacterium]|nr:hypothetical protein [Patescibacteria group bacterium]
MKNSAIDRKKTPTSLTQLLKQPGWVHISRTTDNVILHRPGGNRNELFYIFGRLGRLSQPYIVVDGQKVILDR